MFKRRGISLRLRLAAVATLKDSPALNLLKSWHLFYFAKQLVFGLFGSFGFTLRPLSFFRFLFLTGLLARLVRRLLVRLGFASAIARPRRLSRRFFGVVRHVPAGAFEPDRGRGQKPVHFPLAFRTDGYRRVGKLSDSFKPMLTLLALVFVERHR